jgi:hypothetical protein
MTSSNGAFDEYRKTCSIIFGNATASQLRFLSASIDLQQSLLTSCDGLVANQLNWLQNYTKENKGSNLFLEPFLRVYTSYVELYMKYVSSLYDTGTLNIELYKKTIDMLNQRSLKIKEGEAEIEGLPLSQV